MTSLRNILYISLLVLSVCCSAKAYKIQSRIVGGVNAKREDYPHNVAFLLEYGLVMCGGSIISDRVILSVATCMVDFVDTPHQLFAAFQSKVVPDDEIVGAAIDKIILHPSFDEVHFTNDLALLRTMEKIEFTPQIRAIELPTAPMPSDEGQAVTISGWGFMKEPVNIFDFPKFADNLQCQHTKTLGLHECKRSFIELKTPNGGRERELVSRLGKNNICTENSKNEGICIGDMGNGLVSEDGKLAAVATWAFGCGRGLPDVYTKTYPHLNWIKNGMKSILIDETVDAQSQKPSSRFRQIRDKVLDLIRMRS